MNIAENIKLHRQIKSLTQEQLANRLEVNRATVIKWEGGSLLPSLQKTLELSQLFDCSIDYLVNGSKSNSYQDKQFPIMATFDAPAEYIIYKREK